MTGRQRVLAALGRGDTDFMPWTPLIEGYYLSGLQVANNSVDAVRSIGADVFERHIPTWRVAMAKSALPTADSAPDAGTHSVANGTVWTRTRRGDIETRTEVCDNTLIQTTITPIGELRCRWVYNEHATSIPFPMERRVKTVQDLKVLQYEIENLEYEPCYDIFTRGDAAIGDSGIATTTAPACPFHMLLEDEIGLENFYFMLSDYPSEMEETMALMHERHKEIYALIAASPAKVVIDYENTSTTMLSPGMYEKYMGKYIGDYTEIVHRSGKYLLAHMCGKLKGLERQIADTWMDGIVDIAPQPTGDVSLGEAQKMWGRDKIVMGGIDATAFINLSPEGMSQHVAGIQRDIASPKGVFLGSGDAVPKGTPLENLMAVTRAVRGTDKRII